MNTVPVSNDPDETRNAIAAFEQILDAFPDDVATLEALYQAHESLGEAEPARLYILRTAEAVQGMPAESVPASLTDRLHLLAQSDPEAERLLAALPQTRKTAPPSGSDPQKPARSHESRQRPIEAEMAFAWKLKEAGLLPEEDYARLVHDLSEISADAGAFTLSLLHVMQERGIKNFESILAYVSRDSGTAILPITSFEPPTDILSVLPIEFMTRHGVAFIDFLGPDALVAILNPYNQALRLETQRLCKRTCHFFLALPSEFDAFLARLKEIRVA
ncbi:MAG: hypothetical protein U1E27_04945 [Kiritimatiellia bacterium]|nr:hypothetical protein [Kiritimatiellia bacterium]